jgi:tRNA (guanine-N7-)-methyltransferase
MTGENASGPALADEIELLPSDYFTPLELAECFSTAGPLEIDIGCGDGAFLVARAVQFPERNFLGLEKLGGRIRRGCKKTARLGLTNVRFLRIESGYAMQYLLPPGAAEIVHLLFPDPWPKSKHRRRRIVTPDFLALVHRVLQPGGRFRIATDQQNYFGKIRDLISPATFVESILRPEETFPITTFEKHFLAEGAPIYRLELRKVS